MALRGGRRAVVTLDLYHWINPYQEKLLSDISDALNEREIKDWGFAETSDLETFVFKLCGQIVRAYVLHCSS